MERLTESNLLQNSETDPRSQGFLIDDVLNPFVNGTGVIQIYNNFVDEKVEPAYVSHAKTLSGKWALHTLASAGGAVLTYALAGKATGMGLGAVSTGLGLEGTAAKVLSSHITANIVGAGLYDLAKSPNPGETRIGNAVGSMAAFGAFSLGNGLLANSKTIAQSGIYTGLGRVAVGAAGGLTGLEVSHFVSNQLGSEAKLTWDDRVTAMVHGGFVNFALPPVQKTISNVVDHAMNRNPFKFNISAEQEAKLMEQAIKGTISEPDLKALKLKLDTKAHIRAAEAELKGLNSPDSASAAAEAKGELPRLILLKEQRDPVKRQAQMEMVAGELARFIGDAKKSLHAAVYDFRLTDPKVERLILDAMNGRAEVGVDVKLAFFQPAEKSLVPDGKAFSNNAEKAGKGSRSGEVSPQSEAPLLGPSREFLDKLSPKIKTQTFKEGAQPKIDSIPDPLSDVFKPSQSKGSQAADKVIDVQRGNTDGLGDKIGMGGIEGSGKLMHNKYFVKDAGTPRAEIWTGSANITDPAFGRQDNNIIIVRSPELAKVYEANFQQLWDAGKIVGTGKDQNKTVKVGDSTITVAFSPGDGKFIDAQFATRIAAADHVHIASMVISSPEILRALADKAAAGKLTGVYDGPQMSNIARMWDRSKSDLSKEKLQLWNDVKKSLVRKNSHPYSPDGPHDYMHNKTVSLDGKTVITGSFNLSNNAQSNAENILIVENPKIATQYRDYISDLVTTYGRSRRFFPSGSWKPAADAKPLPPLSTDAKPLPPLSTDTKAPAPLSTTETQIKIPPKG